MSDRDSSTDEFPSHWKLDEQQKERLRYGENPHQQGAVYLNEEATEANALHAAQLNPTAEGLSYVNYLDVQSALELVKEFDAPAAAVIKHAIPAGCATASTLGEAYLQAHSTDPMSAYGGIVALNRECDVETANNLLDSPFKAIVIAPSYSDEGLAALRENETLRILETGDFEESPAPITDKHLPGGHLVQERNLAEIGVNDLECVTEREPTDEQIDDLLFSWRVVKHVMSNGTVLASGTETVGVGSGQPSRIDSVHIATRKARDHAEGKDTKGSVLATDGFAFPDLVEAAADAGVEGIIQPGGSIRDEDVIAAANEHDIPMVFTGQRCFRHG